MKNKASNSHETVNIGAPPKVRTVIRIPLNQLLEDEHQPREKFDEVKIQELARSIKSQGLQQLPEVNFGYKDSSGITYYYLKAGARRRRAYILLNLDEMECVVDTQPYSGNRSTKRRLQQGAENSSREPLTHSELVKLVEEVIADEIDHREGATHGAVNKGLQRVAAAYGMSVAWALNYHTLSGLLPELRDMLDEDSQGERLNFSVGLALARAPQDVQHSLLKEARPYFERGGHAVGYAYIVRNARETRVKRGEKIRGRGFDDKLVFMRISEKLLDLATSFGGGRGSHDYRVWIELNLGRMQVHEVDRMLSDLNLAIEHFSQLRDMVSTKREFNYRKFQKPPTMQIVK